jgi:hypothetical protein
VVDSQPNVWQLQSRQDRPGLIKALRHSDPEIRGRAAAALRTLNAVDVIPVLREVLRTETDEQVRRNLMMALHVLVRRADVGGIAKIQDVDRLIDILKSRDPDSVLAAIKALGTLGNRLAVEPLIILFHNPSSSPAVRLAAAEALLELKSAPAVVTLLGALRRDSWQVRCNAAAVLGQIHAVWAVAPLTAALGDPHPVVRRTAAAALKRIGTAEAVAALRARFAPQTLPEMKMPEAVPETAPVPASAPPALPDKKDEVREEVSPSGAAETGVSSGHDTRPAEAKIRLANNDARPRATTLHAVPERAPHPQSLPKPMTETGKPTRFQPPSPLKIAPPPHGPVKRLIAFLKRHNDENQEEV